MKNKNKENKPIEEMGEARVMRLFEINSAQTQDFEKKVRSGTFSPTKNQWRDFGNKCRKAQLLRADLIRRQNEREQPLLGGNFAEAGA